LHAISAAVGEQPRLVLWFEDFLSDAPVAGVEAVRRFGAVPVVTWEPWQVSLTAIADGDYDEHLKQWADKLTACDSALYLRFAHEFNGDWYPWSPAGDTSPDDYRMAWRHIHDVFRERGAGNVRWVWCPNAVSTVETPLVNWYPGDDYVDVLAVDGYNWGAAKPCGEWAAPVEIFEAALTEMRAIDADKPMLVAEVACAEIGGAGPCPKAAWISDFVAYLDARADIDGFIWFEHDKETDWRMVSSPQAASAMADALSGRAVACGMAT
jgi:hypothetical protein